MRVFVTGATGFVGSAVVADLMAAGHQVLGLARSDRSAAALQARGAEVHRGDLEDTASLATGAAKSDGVIHTGFIHDFARFAEVCAVEGRALEAMGAALRGTDKPLIIASGVAMIEAKGLAYETMSVDTTNHPLPRVVTELTASRLAADGVRASVVRLSPTTHGAGDHGFVPMLIDIARRTGLSAYVGDGQNRWPAVHRLDAAALFRLALEAGVGGQRYHAVAEEGIPFRAIAEAIGQGLNLPVRSITPDEAPGHFGFLAGFAGRDCPASSAWTRGQTGWTPKGPGLIEDLTGSGDYFAPVTHPRP